MDAPPIDRAAALPTAVEPEGPLSNADLAPVPLEARTWNVWHIASLWVGMSVCMPTYMLASAMIESGMNWWQSLPAILLGNAIVLVPLAGRFDGRLEFLFNGAWFSATLVSFLVYYGQMRVTVGAVTIEAADSALTRLPQRALQGSDVA